MIEEHDARERLKEQYAAVAADRESFGSAACGAFDPIEHARSIGYSEEEIRSVPEGVTCLGCGNPIAVAELKRGEMVLDLGAGGGLDAFLAAQRVGTQGRVIGVDMTAEMVGKATENARKGGYANAVFRLGEIEHLPVEDESVDVAISNCVISHCPDKLAAFKEIRRCLKPGGRMVIADLVTVGTIPAEARDDKVWGEWIAVASGRQEYLNAIEQAGFREVVVVSEHVSPSAEKEDRLRGRILSILLKAYK